MVRLALPGLLMVEAEFLAFEILTLASSYFSTTHLAAQSILSTLRALTFQIPFPISIAASTRVANLIGATLSDAAKTSAKVVRILSTRSPRPSTNKNLGNCRCSIRRNLQCYPPLLSQELYPSTLHQRPRSYRPRSTCPAFVRGIPTF